MTVKNLESLDNNDLTSTYDVSGGDKLFKKNANRNDSFYFQVIWSGMDAFDGVITAQASNNNTDFDNLPAPNSIKIDSVSGSNSIQCAKCDAPNMAFMYVRGSATSGTIILLTNEN